MASDIFFLNFSTLFVNAFRYTVKRAIEKFFELELQVTRWGVVTVLRFLKLHTLALFKLSIDLIVYDRLSNFLRFVIVYCFASILYNARIRICTLTNEVLSVPTGVYIYPSLMWSEREAWDLFGVFFSKNTGLRRLLTDYGFSGHPLRKDFPLSGSKEYVYDDSTRRIDSFPVQLPQVTRTWVVFFLCLWVL